MATNFIGFVNADGNTVSVSADNPLPTSGGGGGGGTAGVVEVSNFPASQPVTGPLTVAQFTAVSGPANTPAWDGAATSGTIIGILKALYAQGARIEALLTTIASNTAPTP